MSSMSFRYLGNSGLQVSQLSLGSWVTFGKMDFSQVQECIKFAFDSGVNFFDNAEVYAFGKSEELMGLAFKKIGLKRNDYILTSKFYWGIEDRVNFKNTLNRKYLTQAIDNSLRRLGTEFVDVAYCHRFDPNTPIFEIVFTMDQIIREGKALYWGTSEWPAVAIDQAYAFAVENGLHRPIVEQPQYNLIHRDKVEKEFSPLYKSMKLGLTTWSPLASGILTGKYLDGIPENSRASIPSLSWLQSEIEASRSVVENLKKLSLQSEINMSQLAIGWCLLNPNVSTVILGASRIEQLKENLGVLSVLNRVSELAPALNKIMP